MCVEAIIAISTVVESGLTAINCSAHVIVPLGVAVPDAHCFIGQRPGKPLPLKVGVVVGEWRDVASFSIIESNKYSNGIIPS